MADDNDFDRIAIRIPYRDIDMQGVMHAYAFIAHAETAIRAFWRHRPQVRDEPVFSMRKFECLSHRLPVADDLVIFAVRVEKIGGRTVGFAVAANIGETPVADIDITWTATDPLTGEPSILPEEIRDWLYGFLP